MLIKLSMVKMDMMMTVRMIRVDEGDEVKDF